MEILREDQALEQVANVACPAGHRRRTRWPCPTSTGATASPSAAWRRRDADDGVVSPGGVGYDINCGVRLLRTDLTRDEVQPQAASGWSTSSSATCPPAWAPAGQVAGSTAGAGRASSREGAALGGRARATAGPRTWSVTEERRLHRRAPTPTRSATAAKERGLPPARHARLGQPLPRGAGGRARSSTPTAARGHGPRARRPGHGDDPLRLARPRPPGLRRLPRDDGPRGGREVRHRAARPPAGLRPARVAGGTRLPGGDGLRRQLRLGQPPGHRPLGRGTPSSRCFGASRRGAGHATSSTTWPTTSPSSRTHTVEGKAHGALRPPQGRHAGLPGRPPGRPARVPRRSASRC